MRALRFLLHTYSYLFHLVLALFLFGIAFVAWVTHAGNFDLPMIPWATGTKLIPFLLIAAPIGILSVVLAVTGRLRTLFAVWTIFVLISVFWGFFFGTYSYAGMDPFQTALWFAGGTLLAMLGGISQLKPLR